MKPRKDEPIERHEYLQVKFTNNTDDLIDETSVTFGSNQCTFGMIGLNKGKTNLGWTKPVGTNAVVSWRDKQKIRREQTVDFSKIYDPEKAGTLNFTVTQTNVFATFVQIDRK